jgi:hypothetical protein
MFGVIIVVRRSFAVTTSRLYDKHSPSFGIAHSSHFSNQPLDALQ